MATLRVTRGEAAGVLGAQIDAGRAVLDYAEGVRDQEEYNDWTRKLTAWIDVTKEALAHVYVGDAEVASFEDRAVYRPGYVLSADTDWSDYLGWRVGAVEDGISRLKSLRTTLAFAEEPFVVRSGTYDRTTGINAEWSRDDLLGPRARQTSRGSSQVP
jgi:hypothetical protein